MAASIDLSIFKDYDVRGTYPTQMNGDVIRATAHAIVRKFHPKTVAICRDMRLSGEELRNAFVETFTSLGINVYDAGLVGTEMQYFIAGTKDYDLVIMISASHNPPEFNGFKMVMKGPVAVSGDSGMYAVRDLIKEGPLPEASQKGTVTMINVWEEWKKKLLTLVDVSTFKKLKVVIDAGNGMGGVIADYMLKGTAIEVIPLFFEPDGHFPNHVPNPLIPANNEALKAKVLETHADLGVTFDGDADRMFLMDDKGRLLPGTITTALLSRYILKNHPGETIIYNAICGRIVPKVIETSGGKGLRFRVGHSPIKQKMRELNAVFAGEHSGHYYHRDFFFAESGIGTAMMIFALLSGENKKLSAFNDEFAIYPASGEINFVISDIPGAVTALKTGFPDATSIDEIDGISVWYPTFWFNVRASKTEPLLRLNVEADNDAILADITATLTKKIEALGGKKK